VLRSKRFHGTGSEITSEIGRRGRIDEKDGATNAAEKRTT
jgi:hypothetical protein